MSKNRRGAVKLSDLQSGAASFEALGVQAAEQAEKSELGLETGPKPPETAEQAEAVVVNLAQEQEQHIVEGTKLVRGESPEAEQAAQQSEEQARGELKIVKAETQKSIREIAEPTESESEPRIQMIEGEARIGGMTQEQIQSALDKVLKHKKEITTPEIQARAKQVYDAYYTTHPGVGKSKTEEQEALEKDFLEVQKWERTVEDLNTSIEELQEKLEVFHNEEAPESGMRRTAREPIPFQQETEKIVESTEGIDLPVDLTRTKTGWQAKPSAGFSRTRTGGIRVEPTSKVFARQNEARIQENKDQDPSVQTIETQADKQNKEDLLFNNPELAQKYEALSDRILQVDKMMDKYKNLLRTGRLEQDRFEAVIEPLKAEKAGLEQSQDRLLEQAEQDAQAEPSIETGEVEISKLPVDMQEALREPDKAEKLMGIEDRIAAVDAKIAQYDARYGGGKNPEKYAMLMQPLKTERLGLEEARNRLLGKENEATIEYGLTEFSDEEMKSLREEVANENALPETPEEMVIERTAYPKTNADEARTLEDATEPEFDTIKQVPEFLAEPVEVSDTVSEPDKFEDLELETEISAQDLATERNKKDLEFRLKELEKTGADEWSMAYSGMGLEWTKAQWDKLSKDKKLGETKSEKQQFYEIRTNLLRGDIRTAELVGDLKNIKDQVRNIEKSLRASSGTAVMGLQEQMQMVQSESDNAELQALKNKESEILREIRKLDELKQQEQDKEKVLFNKTNDLIIVPTPDAGAKPLSADKPATIPAAPAFIDASAAYSYGAPGVPHMPDATGTVRLSGVDSSILAGTIAVEVARAGKVESHDAAPALIDKPDTISSTDVERKFFHAAEELQKEEVQQLKAPSATRRFAGKATYGALAVGAAILSYGAIGFWKAAKWIGWSGPMKLFEGLMDATADWGGYFKKKWKALEDYANKPLDDEKKNKE